MGAILCGLWETNPKKLPKHNSDHDDHGGCAGVTTTMIDFMKPVCSWTLKKNKRQLHPQAQNKKQLNTLEDWLSSSPGLNEAGHISGGDFHVLKQFSNRVYPFLDADREDRCHDQLERKVKACEVEDGEIVRDCSLSRSQSGKKKKVSFRLPEVADIIILDLAADDYFED